MNRAFSPPAIRELEPDIQKLTTSLIDQFIDEGRVEFVSGFAGPLPMTVIAIALGVELERMDDFKRWSDGIVSGIGKNVLDKADLTTIIKSQSHLEEYLLHLIEERERDPQSDLISQIVHSRVDGERLGAHETIEMIIQFLLAGNETTTKLITATMLYLAHDGELAARVRSDAELLGPLIEEILRLEPPSTGLYRTATTDYELGGELVPAGSSLLLVYAAGNRDPGNSTHRTTALFRDRTSFRIWRSDTAPTSVSERASLGPRGGSASSPFLLAARIFGSRSTCRTCRTTRATCSTASRSYH